MSKSPLYFHPTKILFLDDELHFLESVTEILDKKYATVAVYTDPSLVEASLSEYPFPQKKDGFFQEKEVYELGVKSFQFNVLEAYKTVLYNVERFNIPNVVVSDYQMPTCSGITFFKKITQSGLPCQRVLLTGEAGSDLAVEAFNQRLIDRFITKNGFKTAAALNETIFEAQWEFFCSNTLELKQLLKSNQEEGEETPIFDPAYAALIKRTFLEGNFVEFYMIDGMGSTLFVGEDGSYKVLFFQSLAEADLIISEAKEAGDLATFEQLKAYENILCYRFVPGKRLPSVKDWGPLIKASNTMKVGGKSFLYSESDQWDELDRDVIQSFSCYKEGLL